MDSCRCRLLTKDNLKGFLDSVDTILTDCDGVLWNDNETIPGAVETIQQFKEMGKKVFYITNNSSKTRQEYVEKCTRLGLHAVQDDIICTAHVTARYIKDILKYDGKVYLIGGGGLQKEFAQAGIPFICGIPDGVDTSSMDWKKLANMPLDPEVKCVVVGNDTSFDYARLLMASSYLQQPGCRFIATNIDSGLPMGPGRVIPGTGSLVGSVEIASQKKPVILGKPYKPIFDVAMEIHKLDPARTIIIGDRLNTDIALAYSCELKAALFVETGFHKIADAQRNMASNSIVLQKEVPNYYVPSLGDIGTLIPRVYS